MVALLPLLPAPSASGPERWLTPLAVAILLGIGLMAMVRRTGSAGPALPQLPVLLLVLVVAASLSITGVRVAMADAGDEATYLLARSLAWGAALVCLAWIRDQTPSASQVFRALVVGGVLMSLLMIVVGVTGIDWFDSALQARELGVQLPFFKTSGVWRSYGEVGIILSIALAYVLTHRIGRSRAVTLGLVAIVGLAAVVSQSRNVYLALLFVVGLRALGTGPLFAKTARAAVVVAFLLPAVVSVSLPLLYRFDVTRAVIGAGIYEQNVHAREQLRTEAVEWIATHPAQSALGMGHTSWLNQQWLDGGLESGLHNHFLANLVHHGWVIGGLATVVLYLWPLLRLARRLSETGDGRDPGGGRPGEIDAHRHATFLAGVGAVACLGFYEGWFSAPWTVLTAIIWRAAYPMPHARLARLRPPIEMVQSVQEERPRRPSPSILDVPETA